MISIIIPVFNEEEHIGGLIRYLKKKCLVDTPSEIIVIDGGSEDRTVDIAVEAGARVINASKKGRARQMNEGYKSSKGDTLYFLHADSIPPVTLATDITRAVKQGYEAGCYQLRFDDDSRLLRLYGWFTRFDIPAFRFGDQSLFVTRRLFEKSGMFSESLILMEDNEFIGRLRKHGSFRILPGILTTSARKYRDNGNLRLQLIYTLIYTLFYFGVSQKTLVNFYRKHVRQ